MNRSTDTIRLDAGGSVTVGYGTGYIRLCLSNGDVGPSEVAVSLHLSSAEARRLACHLAAVNMAGKSEAATDLAAVNAAFQAWDVAPPVHSAVHLMINKYGRENVIQAVNIAGKIGKAGITGYVIGIAKRLKDEKNKRNVEISRVVAQALDEE